MFETDQRRKEFVKIQNYLNRFDPRFLTKKKEENIVKAFEHFKNIDSILTSYPYRIILEPTNQCNLECSLCSTGTKESNRGKGQMSFDHFKNIIDAINPYAIELYLQNWGEATLHPKLSKMISYANEKGLWTHLSSNLSLKFSKEKLKEMLIDSGLQILHVAIDGISQSTYEKYRKKGNLNQVIKNLNTVLELRGQNKLPLIRASMLANRYNEHEVEQFNELMLNMGLDEWSVDKLQVNPNSSLEWLPNNQELKYQNYNSSLEKEILPCFRLWSEMVINWDSNLSACCLVDDKNADFENILNMAPINLSQIWNNLSYVSARSFFKDHSNIRPHTICHECKNRVGSKELSYVGKTFSLKLNSTKLSTL